MIFVVFSHVQSPQIYARFYIPVLLSTFFFASGYTFNCRNNFADFLKHKISTFLWPFVVFGVCKAILAIVVEGDAVAARLRFLLSVRGIWDDLWFIMCLFTCELLWYPFAKWQQRDETHRKNLLVVVVSVILAVASLLYTRAVDLPLPFQIENACIALPCIMLGYMYKRYGGILKKREKFGWIAVPVYILLVLTFENNVDIHKAQYDSWMLYMLSAIMGIAVLICLCKKLEYRRYNKTLIFWGQNSMIIYIVQGYCIKICQAAMSYLSINISPYVKAPIVVAVTLVMTSVIALLVNKYFSFLLRFPEKKNKNIICV